MKGNLDSSEMQRIDKCQAATIKLTFDLKGFPEFNVTKCE